MTKLEAAIYVYRALEDKSIHARQVTGVASEEGYVDFKKKLEDFDLLIVGNGSLRKLEFALPSEKDSLFAIDMAELLEAPSRMLSHPREFYLADLDFLFTDNATDDVPDVVKNYLDASLFTSTLNSISDHSLPVVPKAIFLQGEKLELSLKYSASDLTKLKGLDNFIRDFVKAKIHRDQKATIIKGVLIEMLKNNEIDRLTVSCLIRRFSEFLDRVDANYQLYVSEFSFEKIKKQVESEKFEFTIKLNKVFSDIQNQLLAVPIALVLVSSQMKPSIGLSLANMTIWGGVIIFGIFMSLLIRNQRSTLNAIKLEIDSQWSILENKHALVAGRLGPHYLQLKSRKRSQSLFLKLVSLIVSISIGVSTALLLYKSEYLHLYKDVLFYGGIGGICYLLACCIWKFIIWIVNFKKEQSSQIQER
jgi:hypothetical protein